MLINRDRGDIRSDWMIVKALVNVRPISRSVGEWWIFVHSIEDRNLVILLPTRQCTMGLNFLKNNVTGNINTTCINILDFVVTSPHRISEEGTRDTTWVKLRASSYLGPMNGRYFGPAFGTKNSEVTNPLSLSSKGFQGNTTREASRWYEVTRVDGISGSLCPVGVAEP